MANAMSVTLKKNWIQPVLLVALGFVSANAVAAQAGGAPQNPPATPTATQSQTPANTTPLVTPPIPNVFPTTNIATDSSRKDSGLGQLYSNESNPGEIWGNYEVKQSFELGGRVSTFSGSRAMWDTFVNLGTGPRLLEYAANMHAKNHRGLLFDDLSFSNYGYGGDPNNLSRLRISKNKIYNLDVTFRRDQNVFDYDLLANPLNPATSVPNIPVLNSPHEMLLSRRMTDINLRLFPQSRVSVRLGYSRVVNSGSAFSTIHEGTEALLFQPTSNTTDRYQAGVSVRLFPRTNINFDEFYTVYKGDTTTQLNSLPFTLAGGIPVDLGLPFNSGPGGAGQPCATPLLAGGIANPACNGYFNYNLADRLRNHFPTEQVSFQSHYFRKVDFSGRLNYSDGRSTLPAYLETFDGLSTRDRLRNSNVAGNAFAKRLSLNGDFAATWNVTNNFRLVESFRYDNFRIPGFFNLNGASLFGATLLSSENTFTPATCPPPFTAATCPQHSSSSGPDFVNHQLLSLLKQSQKINTFEAEYDISSRLSAHAGFRYEHRNILDMNNDAQVQTFFPGPTAALANRGACVGHPLAPDGTCTVTVIDNETDLVPINGYSLIAGINAQPINTLRVRFDTELFYADNVFTRISPRHMQTYRLRSTYKPREWMNFSGAVTIFENRNNSGDVGNLQHNRSYSISAEIAPPQAKWGFDVSYDYNDVFSQTNICFVATPVPPGSISCGSPFLSGLSFYTDKSHFVSGDVFVKPTSRVTASVGYTLTSTVGSTLILNPNSPTGPLSFNYHLPSASLAIAITKNLVYKTNWNFYGYNEKSDPGPTSPRDFRGNLFTASLRYSM